MSDDRMLPTSELDLNLMLTNTEWGRQALSKELRDKLNSYAIAKDDDGEPIKNEKGEIQFIETSLWDLLQFYNRDIRLANLSEWNGELKTCRYFLDLAGDYLQENMNKPFVICLSRAVSIMETSQSKNGFLRRQTNTLTQVHKSQSLDPPKKGFFGGSQKKQSEGY